MYIVNKKELYYIFNFSENITKGPYTWDDLISKLYYGFYNFKLANNKKDIYNIYYNYELFNDRIVLIKKEITSCNTLILDSYNRIINTDIINEAIEKYRHKREIEENKFYSNRTYRRLHLYNSPYSFIYRYDPVPSTGKGSNRSKHNSYSYADNEYKYRWQDRSNRRNWKEKRIEKQWMKNNKKCA